MTETSRSRPSRRVKLRMLVGFAAVPPFVAAFTYVLFLAFWRTGLGMIPDDPADAALSQAFAAAITALLVVPCGALPAVLWLVDRGLMSLPRVLIVGAALGALPLGILGTLILVHAIQSNTLRPDPLSLLQALAGAAVFMVIGTASAGVFWAVGLWGSELDRGKSIDAPVTSL